MHLHTIPDVRPCDTAPPLDTGFAFDPLKIHRIFGYRRFRNPNHINSAANNATLIDAGKPPTTLGAFTNIPKSNEGTTKLPHCHFLEKFHTDIVYGDCKSMGGHRYGLLLVDVATRYYCFYGLKSTTSNEVIKALFQFRADVGHLPLQFRDDFNRKLMGGKCLRWINDKKSNIIAAPAKR